VVDATTAHVAVVVLNWNAWPDTIACVESLLRSQRVPDHIVVCDNGSLDGSVEHLAQWMRNAGSCDVYPSAARALAADGPVAPLALVAIDENGGYAAGNNVGLQFALARCDADFVWILNCDVIVAPDALKEMLEVAAADPSIGIVGSKLLRFDQPDTIQALGGGRIIPVLCHDTQLGSGRKSESAGSDPIELDHLVGASLLVRAAAIRDVGPIDESYFLYREETDWCIRMRRNGWRLYCCPQASVWHRQSHSIGFKSPLHDYYAVRNMLHLVAKFYPLAFPTAFGYFACRAFAPKILRLEFERLAAVVAAYRDFLAGVSGRRAQHTDRVLMNNYIAGPVRLRVPASALNAAKTAAGSLILAIVLTLTAAAAATVRGDSFAAPAHRERIQPLAESGMRQASILTAVR
jgi:GT2 family glycosyltransferase